MLIGEKGKKAYVSGYRAAREGKSTDDNPYNYHSLKGPTLALTAWWRKGYDDAADGKPSGVQ